MTIESSTFINTLNTEYPRTGDLLKEGDDHIRLIKANIKNTFPNINSRVSMSSVKLNGIDLLTEASTTALTIKGDLTLLSGKTINFGGNAIKRVGEPSVSTDAATKNYVDTRINSELDTKGLDLLKMLFPVGGVYCSGTVATNPATLFGFGTWSPFGVGSVIGSVGTASGRYNISSGQATSGSATTTLLLSNVPTHSHTMSANTVNLSGVTMSTAGEHYHDSGWGEAYADRARFGVVDNTNNNYGSNESDYDNYKYKTSTAGGHVHTLSGSVNIPATTTGQTGSSSPFNNQPLTSGMYFWIRIT